MAPSREQIKEWCAHLEGDQSKFFQHVSPNVVWDVMGTHPASGHYTSLEDWKKGALGTVNKYLRDPVKMKCTNVIGGGDQDWATIELTADSVAKDGTPYPQRYAWIMRFDDSNTIVEVHAYLDSALVEKVAATNS